MIPKWYICLLYNLSRCPPIQVECCPGLVIGPTESCSTEGLLTHHCTRGLVVEVKVTGGVTEGLLSSNKGTRGDNNNNSK